MGALAILAMLEGAAKIGQQVANLVAALRTKALNAPGETGKPQLTALDVEMAIARGRAAATDLSTTADSIIARIGDK